MCIKQKQNKKIVWFIQCIIENVTDYNLCLMIRLISLSDGRKVNLIIEINSCSFEWVESYTLQGFYNIIK